MNCFRMAAIKINYFLVIFIELRIQQYLFIDFTIENNDSKKFT